MRIGKGYICFCTFIGDSGFVAKECKYHKEHCHEYMCKKKALKGQEYCKEHKEYWDNQPGDLEGFGGSDF